MGKANHTLERDIDILYKISGDKNHFNLLGSISSLFEQRRIIAKFILETQDIDKKNRYIAQFNEVNHTISLHLSIRELTPLEA